MCAVRHCPQDGLADLLFANEDEARELVREMDGGSGHDNNMDGVEEEAEKGEEEKADEEEGRMSYKAADRAMQWMLQYCKVATVSLGRALPLSLTLEHYSPPFSAARLEHLSGKTLEEKHWRENFSGAYVEL